MDYSQAACDFLGAHAKLREIEETVSATEGDYLSAGGLGSASMEMGGVLGQYLVLAKERREIIQELQRLRAEAGDDELRAALGKLPRSEDAIRYLERLPLDHPIHAGVPAERRGFFSRLFGGL